MTAPRDPDAPEGHDDLPLDSRDDEAVRRLLAAVGGERPALPGDVAARLDDVLADLAADPGAAPRGNAVVTSLSDRRRRRWPQVLVAAAAVGVLGVAVGTLADQDQGAGGSAASSGASNDDTRVEAGGQAATVKPKSSPEAVGEVTPLEVAPPAAVPGSSGGGDQSAPSAARRLPSLESESLRGDARRIAVATDGRATPPEPKHARPDGRHGATALTVRCEAPPTSRGDDPFAVRFEGRRAVLVLRAPHHDRRVVDVYACRNAGNQLARTVIPAP